MNTKDWLEKVAYLKFVALDGCEEKDTPKSWLSKFDDSYITFEGLEEDIRFLADREITEELTHGVGFSKKNNKWYGWSHRAIYGFEIGSTCKKGDCHYIGRDENEQKQAAIRFWESDSHQNTHCEGIKTQEGNRFFIIKWEYTSDIPNEKLRGTISGINHLITPTGRGEWVAKTIEDAKQMAVDFNEGVS